MFNRDKNHFALQQVQGDKNEWGGFFGSVVRVYWLSVEDVVGRLGIKQ